MTIEYNQNVDMKQRASGGETTSETRVLPDGFYQPFLSTSAKTRRPAPIRSLVPLESTPGMLSLLAGKPNPETYPFTKITLNVRMPTPSESPSSEATIDITGSDLTVALQYGMTSGVPGLVSWLEILMHQEHGVKIRGTPTRLSMGSGSQDLLYKAFSALLEEGDILLVEAPTYPGVIPVIDSVKARVVELVSDAEGIVPESLEVAMERLRHEGIAGKVKALYTIPFGANPTGTTTTLARRRAVLALARKWNFLILEDDPYYHLYYGKGPSPPSYISLEHADGSPEVGRVVRFDSLSKILAAGFRLGWITGPASIVACVERHSAASTMQPPSLSQIVVLKLLEAWGLEGFLAHARQVAGFYERRRDVFEQFLQKHLAGLAEWKTPDAAMFYWVKLRLPGVDSGKFIEARAVGKGILMLPGSSGFMDERNTRHVRLSFSMLDDGDVDEVLARLAEAIRNEWRLQSNPQIAHQ